MYEWLSSRCRETRSKACGRSSKPFHVVPSTWLWVVVGLFVASGCGEDSGLHKLETVVTIIDGGVAIIDGGTSYIDGGVMVIDGGTSYIDGGVVVIDGGVVVIDGGIAYVDGGVVPIDGGVRTIDGGVMPIDGGVVPIDGGVRTIDGGVMPIDGGVMVIDGGVQTIDGGVTPTCSDGVQNGDETGVDCGGSLCAPCTCWHYSASQRNYWVCAGARTWTQAQAFCASFNTTLVSIRNAAEQAAVDQALDGAYLAGAVAEAAGWVGGYEPSPGTWVWSDGSPWTPYSNWALGEPNDGAGSGVPEDCMTNCTALGAVTACGAAGWGDSRCDAAYQQVVCAD